MACLLSDCARRLAPLLIALALALAVSAPVAAQPQSHWLQQPCGLLSSGDYARLLSTPVGALAATPRIGRRESECLWTDAAAVRSLRLVLYPAKDAARVATQLQRLQSADAAATAFDAGGTRAVLTADRTQLSVGVGHWMLSLFGSAPLDQSGAHALAAALVQRLSLAESAR